MIQHTNKSAPPTDPDSRGIIIIKSIVEVAHNTHNAVDDKYNLIVYTQATNTNDGKALYKAATQAKENLQLQKEDPWWYWPIKTTIPEPNYSNARMII